jgi:hypothetical protein
MSGITNISALNSSTARATKETTDLGKDEFLKLLVTQLKYQDPLSPMQNEAFIAQLAQFSTLEAMKNVERSFKGVEAYSLIGKLVVIEDKETLQEMEGIVTGVKTKAGQHYAIIPMRSNYVEKSDVLQAFNTSNMMYDLYKNNLFTAASLNSDNLIWKPEITSMEDYAKALGFSNPNDVPVALKKIWDSSFFKEVPIEDITHVFANYNN